MKRVDAAPDAGTNLPSKTALTADSLILRVGSGVVLVPSAVLATYLGGPVFTGLIAFLLVVMCFEWTRMIEGAEPSRSFLVLAGAGGAGMICGALDLFQYGFAICVVGGVAAALLARSKSQRYWLGFASIYICMSCLALLWLRTGVENGRALTMMLFAVVWFADTGAYFAGRLVGGPRLSPALSPAKTWAGAIGGVLAGGLAGVLGAIFIYGLGNEFFYALIGGALGLVSILGDMTESAFKRIFGVKDISGFIPGHGGVLDRLDGMIFATAAITLVLYGHILASRL